MEPIIRLIDLIWWSNLWNVFTAVCGLPNLLMYTYEDKGLSYSYVKEVQSSFNREQLRDSWFSCNFSVFAHFKLKTFDIIKLIEFP